MWKARIRTKISTGFPSQGQPLNCQAGPWAKTATTRSQSSVESLLGLSITLYGTVELSALRRWINTSLSLLFMPAFFSSVVTYLDSCSSSFTLYMVTMEVVEAGMMMIGVRLVFLLEDAPAPEGRAAEAGCN